jgi:DNA topoisomerase-3
LLARGRTSVLRGFKSSTGKTFDAALVLEGGKVTFDLGRTNVEK